MRQVRYEHLLSLPWSEFDCRAVVRALYADGGVALPDGALDAPPVPGCWDLLGTSWTAAREALDVIASDPLGIGAESHVSVLIRSGPPWTVVSSSRLQGVHACRPWALRRVLGVYRLRRGAA